MSLTEVYKQLEKAQDELRELDTSAYPPKQREAVELLSRNVDAVVELAFLAGNLGEPTG